MTHFHGRGHTLGASLSSGLVGRAGWGQGHGETHWEGRRGCP